MKIVTCFSLAVAVATLAQAETLYKVVGPDGKITYTDQLPADRKSTTALQFADAPTTPLPASVLKYQAGLQKSLANRLALSKSIGGGTPTLFSASWCGYCKQAKAFMNARGIRFHEVDIDTPEGGRAYFEAGGARGVPLLIADGKRQSGFSAESYDGFFSAKK